MKKFVLLVSFEESQDKAMNEMKGELETRLSNDGDIKLLFVVGVHHEIAKKKKFSEKLDKIVKELKSLVIIITSPTVCAISDKGTLQKAVENIKYVDKPSATILSSFLHGEREKPQLALMSLGDKMEVNGYFNNIHHLEGFGEETARWIANKCR